MVNVLICVLCAVLGGAFIQMGFWLVSERYRRLTTENVAPGTFLHFHYIFGIVLGAADVLVGLMSLVIAVLVIIYPLY